MDGGNAGIDSASIRLKRAKRTWTPDEDALLVSSVTELCKGGYWRADNGFRSGYLIQLEKMMEAGIPGCGIRANPHIESRLKTLRKQFFAITEMLQNSSVFSWNEDRKMITCQKTQFEDWVVAHATAGGLRNKPFVHYEALTEVFGKDKNTSASVEPIADLDANPDSDPDANPDSDPTDDDSVLPAFEAEPRSPPTPSPTPAPTTAPASSQGTSTTSKTSGSWKKRARDKENSELASTFAEFVDLAKQHIETSSRHMSTIVDHMVRGTRHSEKRLRAIEAVLGLPDLSSDQKEDACELMDDRQVELLLALGEERKVVYIRKLLARRFNVILEARPR